MRIKHYMIATIIVMASGIITTTAKTFEGFWESNYYNNRVGLDFHNGEYGFRHYDYYGWYGRVTSSTDNTPYNHWFQAGVHNTYEHTNDKEKQGIYGFLKHSSTLIELDIHSGSSDDFEVYHTSNPDDANCNAHLANNDTMQSGIKLSDCLKAIKDFHDDYPNHHVITVWVELKGDDIWSNANGNVLNQLLIEHLGDEILIDQSEIQGQHNSLRDAVNIDGWPTLGELRGKVIVVLFNYLTPNQRLDDYQDSVIDTPRAFVAPNMHKPANITGNVDEPEDFTSEEDKGSVIFYSLAGDNYADHTYGLDIFRNNRISSTFYTDSANTPGVSEHRDFLIQHARWGKGRNDQSLYEPDQYSGRLKAESGSYPIPAVAQLKSKQDPSKCLAIENASKSNRADVIVTDCKKVPEQTFAIIDVAIDLHSSSDMPLSRGFLIQAVIGGNTQTPNEKIVEVKGNCCGNTANGTEVFQYTRSSASSNSRPDDQYWRLEYAGDGAYEIININSDGILDVKSSSAEQDKTPDQHYQWTLEKAYHD